MYIDSKSQGVCRVKYRVSKVIVPNDKRKTYDYRNPRGGILEKIQNIKGLILLGDTDPRPETPVCLHSNVGRNDKFEAVQC